MYQSLWIPHKLPGLNDIIGEARKHRMASANQKSHYTGLVKMLAKQLKPINRGSYFKFTWIEKNRRRDPDNISCGMKFIVRA